MDLFDDEDTSSALSTARTDLTEAAFPSSEPTANSRLAQPNNVAAEQTNNEYEGFPWPRFPQYSKPDPTKRIPWSWAWELAWKLQHITTSKIIFICKLCVKKKDPKPGKWQYSGGTAAFSTHLDTRHGVGKDGEPLAKRRRIDEALQRTGENIQQAIANRRVDSFDPQRLKRSTTRWFAYENIAWWKANSEPWRRMMLDANSMLEDAGCLPTDKTIVAWLRKDFEHYLPEAIAVFDSFPYDINFTFDLWTTSNSLSLNGIFAHWIDAHGTRRKMLLAVPEITEKHSGTNIGHGVEIIIKKFGLQDRIGYFTLDNAPNCDTAVKYLADTFHFNHLHRRVRCTPHTINLVAKEIMYGTDLSAFEEEEEADTDKLVELLEKWRRKGALGKLHNVIMWILDRHADSNRARRFNAIRDDLANSSLNADDKKPAGLSRPNDTRWNSHYYAFESAVKNRTAMDDFAAQEKFNYERALRMVQDKNTKRDPLVTQIKEPILPVIVQDALSDDDWHMVTRYMDILKPLLLATKRLEGNPANRRIGLIWEVLPVYEALLSAIEARVTEYEQMPIDSQRPDIPGYFEEFNHLRMNLQLGWQKLTEYYKKLDRTPIYVAAFVLHPAYRWRKLKELWKDNDDDIQKAEAQVQELWESKYKHKDLGSMGKGASTNTSARSTLTPSQSRNDFLDNFLTERDDYITVDTRETTPTPEIDEMEDFQNANDGYLFSVTNPIQFWLDHRGRWPRVSYMALEIYGVPPSEADNERFYRRASEMVTKTRHDISAEMIGVAQGLVQWDQEKFINWK